MTKTPLRASDPALVPATALMAGGSAGDITAGHLIWIIHSANESGYR